MSSIDSLGVWVRHRRTSLHLTQAELAHRACCTVSMIRKIERDERRPSTQIATLLAAALLIPDTERNTFVRVARAEWPFERLRPRTREAQIPRRPFASLPAPVGPLIGREREVSTIRHYLNAPGGRLVTITGPGGVGKTRLAIQVAAELRATYPDGIWFVELAHLNDPDLVPATIASALQLDAGQEPLTAITSALHERTVLLLLDNAEQVTTAAPALAALLTATPTVTMLVTSRAPLRITFEQEYPLAPLTLPPDDASANLDTYAAVQLFIRRTSAVQPDFALTDHNRATIAAICRRLDGLPLAIELAAARIRLLPPAALLQRLTHALDILTDGPRDLPPRQRTLRGTLDWSVRLLSPTERFLFAQLGVFVDGATLPAIEASCTSLAPEAPLAALTTLVEQGLVRQIARDGDEARYAMLETVREYALELLAAEHNAAVTRSLHAAFFLRVAETTEPGLRGADQHRCLDRLEADHDNLRTALNWLSASGQHAPALHLAGILSWFWLRRSYLTEGRAHLHTTLSAAPSNNINETLAHARGRALNGAAVLAIFQSDRPSAGMYGEEAIAIFRQFPDNAGLALALAVVSVARLHKGEVDAQAINTEACTRAIASGDSWLIGLTHSSAAQLALFGAGDSEIARSAMAVAFPAMEASGDIHLRADGLMILGLIELADCNVVSARHFLECGLTMARAGGDLRLLALIAASAADAARCQGDTTAAAVLYEESLALHRTLGNVGEVPAIIHNLGHVALDRGQFDAAHDYFVDSLRRQQALGNHAGIAEGLAGLAALAATERQPERAAMLLGAADGIRRRGVFPLWPAERLTLARHGEAVKAQLSPAQFEQNWRAGWHLTLTEALVSAGLESAAEPLAQPCGTPAAGSVPKSDSSGAQT